MNRADSNDLHGALNVTTITSLHKEMCEARTGGSYLLDLSNVTDIDASALQLLLAARARSLQNQDAFGLLNIPPNIRSTMESAGALSTLEEQTSP